MASPLRRMVAAVPAVVAVRTSRCCGSFRFRAAAHSRGAAGEGRVTCPTRSRLKSARERRREALEALCRASPGLPHPSLGNGEERRVKRPGGLPGSSPPARGSLAGDVSAERAARAELARAAGRVRAGVTRTRPREDRREEVRITVLRHGRDSRARRRVLSRRRRQRRRSGTPWVHRLTSASWMSRCPAPMAPPCSWRCAQMPRSPRQPGASLHRVRRA